MNSRTIIIYSKIIFCAIVSALASFLIFISTMYLVNTLGESNSQETIGLYLIQCIFYMFAFSYIPVITKSRMTLVNGIILIVVYSLICGGIHDFQNFSVDDELRNAGQYIVNVLDYAWILFVFGIVYLFLCLKTNILENVKDFL